MTSAVVYIHYIHAASNTEAYVRAKAKITARSTLTKRINS